MNDLEMMENMTSFLNELRRKLDCSRQVLVGDGSVQDWIRYNEACQIFNRRIQQKPLVIVYCETDDDVKITYNTAIRYKLPIRVRSGGHDHEGECSGTNTVLIDLSKIDHIKLDPDTGIARIGPGNRFERLTTELADLDVMIPHGTCATVGIAGFTLGGGWGPWTREKGMCCEYLVGADILLGDGSKKVLNASKGGIPPLLWALRGGGGMSYGIVTELRIQTFPLPAELIKFELEWNPYEYTSADIIQNHYPTIKVLKAWEQIIGSKNTSQLIGTNLKINAVRPKVGYKFDKDKIKHNCVMYGYWRGNQKDLQDFIDQEFKNVPPNVQKPFEIGGAGSGKPYGLNLMSSWDRESHNQILDKLAGVGGQPLPPDHDAPAPHKITSRLVNKSGLGDKGYEGLLRSLTSPLVLPENRRLGLFTYVTLGAITGDYYRQNPDKNGDHSAFPYKDSLYTIQYQTWWNEEETEKELGQDNYVYDRVNRAMDWIENCRNMTIDNTSGAFISFKDASIPTETYFAGSYEKLKGIKMSESSDPYNHFRSRKTII